MHPETQRQALADTGVQPANIFQDVGSSGSVPVGDRPGWTGRDARLRRGDTLTVAALDRISRNCVEPGRRRGVAAPARGGHRFPGSRRVLAPPPQRPPHRGRATVWYARTELVRIELILALLEASPHDHFPDTLIYCFKCRTKTESNDLEQVVLKNRRDATRGVCAVCGTKKFRMGKLG